jgi:hypothetical protein
VLDSGGFEVLHSIRVFGQFCFGIYEESPFVVSLSLSFYNQDFTMSVAVRLWDEGKTYLKKLSS